MRPARRCLEQVTGNRSSVHACGQFARAVVESGRASGRAAGTSAETGPLHVGRDRGERRREEGHLPCSVRGRTVTSTAERDARRRAVLPGCPEGRVRGGAAGVRVDRRAAPGPRARDGWTDIPDRPALPVSAYARREHTRRARPVLHRFRPLHQGRAARQGGHCYVQHGHQYRSARPTGRPVRGTRWRAWLPGATRRGGRRTRGSRSRCSATRVDRRVCRRGARPPEPARPSPLCTVRAVVAVAGPPPGGAGLTPAPCPATMDTR
jgi:hypothetical protein